MEGRTTPKNYVENGESANGKSDHAEEKLSDAELTAIQMEYSAVRDEVLLLMEEHNTQIMNVFVIGIAFLTLVYTVGNDHPNLFLLTYVLMIPMQLLINNKAYMMARCGSYIKVMIEPKMRGQHWEDAIRKADNAFNSEYKFSIGKFDIEHSLAVYGTFIFSVIALVAYAAYYISFDGDTQQMNINIHLPEALGIIAGIIGTAVTFRLCQKGFQFDKVRDKYEMLFKEQMKSKN